jgi:hypothetical protein
VPDAELLAVAVPPLLLLLPQAAAPSASAPSEAATSSRVFTFVFMPRPSQDTA